MSDPCVQGPMFIQIHQSLERLTSAVEKIANVHTRVDHIEEDGRKRDREIDTLFTMVRDIQIMLGKDGAGIKLEIVEALDELKASVTAEVKGMKTELTAEIKPAIELTEFLNSRLAIGIAIGVITLTVVGTVCDVAYHYPLFASLLKIFKP